MAFPVGFHRDPTGIPVKFLLGWCLHADEDESAIDFFQKLGEGHIPTELDNGELSPQVNGLEQFVYFVYCSTGPTTLPVLRGSSKSLEGETLHPTLLP